MTPHLTPPTKRRAFWQPSWTKARSGYYSEAEAIKLAVADPLWLSKDFSPVRLAKEPKI